MTTDTAVGYLRLSQDGHSIERQRHDVEAYANTNGFALVEIYNEGKRASGFDADRPKYTCVLLVQGSSSLYPPLPHWDRHAQQLLIRGRAYQHGMCNEGINRAPKALGERLMGHIELGS